MKSLIESVKAFCDNHDVTYHPVGDRPILRTGFSGRSGAFMTYIHAEEPQRFLEVRTICPVKAPENKRQRIAEFLTRANSAVRLGSFDLDMDDGEITYKTSIMAGENDLDETIVKHLLFANWVTTDLHFPAITAVIFGSISPKKAIESLQKAQDPSGDGADRHKAAPKTGSAKLRFGGRLGRLMDGTNN